MIEEYTLKKLCDKYGINSSNIVNKNNNILKRGEFFEIDKVLNYLVNELKISPINIEKCPSILYRNVNAIKKNVEFLKQVNVNFSNIETCLHVLSTDHVQLRETYEYVNEKYGMEVFNKITSILSVPKEIIIDVENLNLPFKNKKDNLTVAQGVGFGTTNLEDIVKIIHSEEFKNHPELFTSTTLAHSTLERIQAILSMEEWQEEKYKHLLQSGVLLRTKDALIFNIDLAEKYGFDNYLTINYLNKSPSQNYALINYLLNNNIDVVIDGKLNSIFSYQPGVLLKKYGVDIKELMKKYPLEIEKYDVAGGKKK